MRWLTAGSLKQGPAPVTVAERRLHARSGTHRPSIASVPGHRRKPSVSAALAEWLLLTAIHVLVKPVVRRLKFVEHLY